MCCSLSVCSGPMASLAYSPISLLHEKQILSETGGVIRFVRTAFKARFFLLFGREKMNISFEKVPTILFIVLNWKLFFEAAILNMSSLREFCPIFAARLRRGRRLSEISAFFLLWTPRLHTLRRCTWQH